MPAPCEPDAATALTRLLGVRPGTDGAPAPGAARVAQLLDAHSLEVLARLDARELREAAPLTPRQARTLVAAFALGRAVERAARPRALRLDRPGAVARLLAPEVRGLEVETFHVLALDARHGLIAHETVAVGTLVAAPVHPREVFRPALRRGAAGLVVAHNHPSGDPEPSPEDVAVTHRLAAVGRLVGVPLVDHVVLGAGRWVSLRERGELLAEALVGAADVSRR